MRDTEEIWKTAISLRENVSDVSVPLHTKLEEHKTQQSLVILDLYWRKTGSGKSRDFHDVIVFTKLRSQNVFRRQENDEPAFSNPSVQREFSKSSVFVTD